MKRTQPEEGARQNHAVTLQLAKPCCHSHGKHLLALSRGEKKKKENKLHPETNPWGINAVFLIFFSLLSTSLDPRGWRTCSRVFQALESWHWYKHCYLSSQLQKSAQSRKTKCSLIHSILIINITSLNITLSGSRYTISVLKIKA